MDLWIIIVLLVCFVICLIGSGLVLGILFFAASNASRVEYSEIAVKLACFLLGAGPVALSAMLAQELFQRFAIYVLCAAVANTIAVVILWRLLRD